jgi:ubiquinone/menaquinone biosynthesis C-methylase UbiE
MTRYARAHSPEDIRYFRGDAQALPLPDHSFDVCALITTLESTADPQQALREAFRVSRGLILLGILNSLSPLALWRRMRAVLRPTIFSRTRFYAGPGICEMVRRVAREADLEASVQMSSRWGGRLPLGAFYALKVYFRPATSP